MLFSVFRFGCYHERNPKACHLLGDFWEGIKKDFSKEPDENHCLLSLHEQNCTFLDLENLINIFLCFFTLVWLLARNSLFITVYHSKIHTLAVHYGTPHCFSWYLAWAEVPFASVPYYNNRRWTEGGVPGRNRTRACLTSCRGATPQPGSELRCTLPELRRAPFLSYAAPCPWVTPNRWKWMN